MFKVFDFVCTNDECPNVDQEFEKMILLNEVPRCICCFKDMEKIMPAPKGYVRGTSTPIRYH